jgi:hypothetical protein
MIKQTGHVVLNTKHAQRPRAHMACRGLVEPRGPRRHSAIASSLCSPSLHDSLCILCSRFALNSHELLVLRSGISNPFVTKAPNAAGSRRPCAICMSLSGISNLFVISAPNAVGSRRRSAICMT